MKEILFANRLISPYRLNDLNETAHSFRLISTILSIRILAAEQHYGPD